MFFVKQTFRFWQNKTQPHKLIYKNITMDINSIADSLSFVAENIWLKRILIIVIYAVLAKAADLFIDKVLRRLASFTRFTFDDQIISFIHSPLFWTVVLLGFLHAFTLPPPLPAPWEMVLPAAVKSFALLVWFIAIFKLLSAVTERSQEKVLTRGKIGQDLFLLLKNVMRVVVVVCALLWLLAIWRVNLTPLFASAGIAGIAVALAAKDSLANFFGGISIFADKTFTVGDYIILDNAERGEVVEIGIRSTRIKTRDDVLITIPNSILANTKIINESAPVPRFRIRVPVGVAYGTDLDKVEEVLLAVARENPAVVEDPAPRVRLRTFGTSSVDFELLCWVEDPSLKGLQIHNLLKSTYAAFAKHQITIPFPQRDVYIKQHVTSVAQPDGPE